jgi:hypothetical protein
MKKTYAELFTLVALLNHNVKDAKTKGQKKLVKIAEKVKPYLDAYNEKAEDLRLDNASVDKDGNLILNEKGNYSFSKDGLKKLNAASKELNLSDFDYTVIQVNNPEGLDIYTFLDGWVDGVKFIKIDKIDDVEL